MIYAYKGYQGRHEMISCILPHKKRPNGYLTIKKESFNEKFSSDKIIVESYFGKMQALCSIISVKYRWSEIFYYTISAMCVALANCHIDKLSLRPTDVDCFKRYIAKLGRVWNEKKRKRAESLALYRIRRHARLQIGFRAAPSGII